MNNLKPIDPIKAVVKIQKVIDSVETVQHYNVAITMLYQHEQAILNLNSTSQLYVKLLSQLNKLCKFFGGTPKMRVVLHETGIFSSPMPMPVSPTKV